MYLNIQNKIILSDTNIITDLYVCDLLEDFISLDNVYVCDLVKLNEFNSSTCDKNLYDKIKTISTTSEENIESFYLSNVKRKISHFDFLNFVVARNRGYILATGDKRLRDFALLHNVEVIRTLTIIKFMYENKIITKKKSLNACNILIKNNNTFIPKEEINKLIKYINK